MAPAWQVELRWLPAEEGGRSTPIRGGRYTPTARFAGEHNQFSVVLDFAQNCGPSPTNGMLRLLNPDLASVQDWLLPGIALEIMEGTRVVAHGVVEGVEQPMRPSALGEPERFGS